MSAVDVFSVSMTYITTYGKVLFALFGLGISVLVNRILSTALFMFSILSFLLFFVFNDAIFISLSAVALIVGFFLKNIGQ